MTCFRFFFLAFTRNFAKNFNLMFSSYIFPSTLNFHRETDNNQNSSIKGFSIYTTIFCESFAETEHRRTVLAGAMRCDGIIFVNQKSEHERLYCTRTFSSMRLQWNFLCSLRAVAYIVQIIKIHLNKHSVMPARDWQEAVS